MDGITPLQKHNDTHIIVEQYGQTEAAERKENAPTRRRNCSAFHFPMAGMGRVNAMHAVEWGVEEPLFLQLVNKLETEGKLVMV